MDANTFVCAMIDEKRYQDLIYKVIGAAMEVHNELGYGLLEPIYNEALSMELEARGVKAEPEKYLPCFYKSQQMKKSYRMDIVVEDDLIVELKSVNKLCKAHRAQLFNYMRLTKKSVALLINFGGEYLNGERYLYDEEENHCYLVDKRMQPIEMEEDESEIYIDPYAKVYVPDAEK